MKNIFDLVIRFMAISAMLVGVSLAMVATAPESVAAESAVSELVAVESESVSEMTESPMVDTYAQSDDGYDQNILMRAVVPAIKNHDYDRLQQLISAGADLNFRPKGWLKSASIFRLGFVKAKWGRGYSEQDKQRTYKMVKFLLDNGVKIEGPTGQDTSVLDRAVGTDNFKLLELAIAHGADIKRKSISQHAGNYLFYAGSNEMLKYLLDLGLNPNSVNAYSRTPFMRIVASQNQRASRFVKLQLLLAYGADPNMRDTEGKTALDYAKRKLDFEMVEFLKNAKPVSRSDSKAKTPAKDKSDNGDKSEDKVASPKKSESKVPSYGTAGDCADFMQDTPPDVSRAILNILKRHKISCYTVPDQCEDLLKGESPDIRKKLKVALGTLRIYCYQ